MYILTRGIQLGFGTIVEGGRCDHRVYKSDTKYTKKALQGRHPLYTYLLQAVQCHYQVLFPYAIDILNIGVKVSGSLGSMMFAVRKKL